MSNLRFDQIILKISRNSYGRDESISEQLSFNSNKPFNYACVAVEFDIRRHSSDFVAGKRINENYFTLTHTISLAERALLPTL